MGTHTMQLLTQSGRYTQLNQLSLSDIYLTVTIKENVKTRYKGQHAPSIPRICPKYASCIISQYGQCHFLGARHRIYSNCFKEVTVKKLIILSFEFFPNHQISTRVDSTISGKGWAWAIICCFCGSWCASCLVNCLSGFRKYTHSCPSCNVIIGEVEPDHSGCRMAIIIISVLLVIALIAAVIVLNSLS